jgi:hypothetical protein
MRVVHLCSLDRTTNCGTDHYLRRVTCPFPPSPPTLPLLGLVSCNQ